MEANRHPVSLALAAAVFVLAGGAIGYLARGSDSGEQGPSTNLQASQIGDAAAGRAIYTRAGCVACHSYRGRGGRDGPPLDFMRGRLSAAEIAAMSGRIWNHVPQMQKLFKQEGIPFPTFQGHEMADLVAYLHGGGAPPELSKAMMGGAGDEGR